MQERTLKLLAEVLDTELDPSISKAETKEHLALTLVLRVLDDDTSAETAKQIMFDSHLSAEAPAEETLAELTDDMVWDFALLGEQVDTLSLIKTWAREKAEREGKRVRVQSAIDKAYPKSKQAAVCGRKKTVSKAAAAKAATAQAAAKERWFKELTSDARRVVERDAPPRSHIHIDTNNGCFRVKMPHTRVKSFSWTQRGEAGAAMMALGQLWAWHEEVTGEGPPAHLAL